MNNIYIYTVDIFYRPSGDILIDKLDLENGTPWEMKKGKPLINFLSNNYLIGKNLTNLLVFILSVSKISNLFKICICYTKK